MSRRRLQPYPPGPIELGPLPECGATNDVLGLRCNREPHPPERAHYQDDGNAVHAWYEPICAQCAPAPATFLCRELGHTVDPS